MTNISSSKAETNNYLKKFNGNGPYFFLDSMSIADNIGLHCRKWTNFNTGLNLDQVLLFTLIGIAKTKLSPGLVLA